VAFNNSIFSQWVGIAEWKSCKNYAKDINLDHKALILQYLLLIYSLPL